MEAKTDQVPEIPEVSPRRRKTDQERKIAQQRAALRWWMGTVVLTLFPTLTTVFIAVLRGDTAITWEFVFDGGELILSSFLIVTSTWISGYTVKDETVFTDLVRYILHFLSFAQLIAYTVIKTNQSNNQITVITVSLSALFISVCISWIWYKLTD